MITRDLFHFCLHFICPPSLVCTRETPVKCTEFAPADKKILGKALITPSNDKDDDYVMT